MDVRLIVRGDIEPGTTYEFWKQLPDAVAVPRRGDRVLIVTYGGAPRHLSVREVIAVEWAADLDQAQVWLSDLDAGWLRANRQLLHDSGWMTAMAG